MTTTTNPDRFKSQFISLIIVGFFPISFIVVEESIGKSINRNFLLIRLILCLWSNNYNCVLFSFEDWTKELLLFLLKFVFSWKLRWENRLKWWLNSFVSARKTRPERETEKPIDWQNVEDDEDHHKHDEIQRKWTSKRRRLAAETTYLASTKKLQFSLLIHWRTRIIE